MVRGAAIVRTLRPTARPSDFAELAVGPAHGAPVVGFDQQVMRARGEIDE